METEKLYEHDPYLREFTGTVLSCEVDKNSYKIVLNRTAFYPESGGQGADYGTLDGAAVTDVYEKEGTIFHTCAQALEIGKTVIGTIDWDRRFDHMQQHSGEHIISGILCADYHCDNVGFHMGADTVTIDYNTDITWEQVLDAERKANAVIWANRPTEITYPDAKALKTLEYRSKKELTGQVRIVTFPEADCCACCGTHVRRAGEVGLIKALSCQKFRDGVRIEILCGQRALNFLDVIYDQTKSIGQRLSVKPQDSLAAVERMEMELAALKHQISELETDLFASIAREYQDFGDVLLFRDAMNPDSVRRLADTVAQSCGGLAAVFAGPEDGKFNYALVRSDHADISAMIKTLNTSLQGRGGGRNGFAQGSVQAEKSAIEAFFHNL